MNTIIKCLALLLLAPVAMVPVTIADGLNAANDDYLGYVSPDLKMTCDSILIRRTGRNDSPEHQQLFRLQTYTKNYLTINDTSYFCLILGCSKNVEFIVIDSARPDIVRAKIRFFKPGSYIVLNTLQVIDINGDGFPELKVNMSAGEHGFSSSFLTLDLNNLHFVTDDKGNYHFYAPRGGISLLPTGNPNIYDIEVGGWPEAGQTAKSTVYKWNGKNYEFKENIIKTDK